MPDYELRIGICGCTSQWTGKIEGQTVSVARLRGDVVSPSLNLTLKEVIIPDGESLKDRKLALRDTQSHFFLDALTVGEYTETELTRFWQAGFRAGYRDLRLGTATAKYRGFIKDNAEWVGVPSVKIILSGASRIAGRLSPLRFLLWINNLPEPPLRSF